MTIDRKTLFDRLRSDLFGGFLTSPQVDGIGKILDEAERRGITDVRYLAYRLATTFHETGRAMVPVREAGSDSYLRSKPYWPWIGEGLVQVTWEANARKFGAKQPGDCMSWPVALRALFDGMDDGLFTGRKLSTYFNDTTDDPVNARRIINGVDRAEIIAGYHRKFLAALSAAMDVKPALLASQSPVPTINTPASRAAVPPVPSPGLLSPAPAEPTGLRALWAGIKAHFGVAT